MLICAEHLTKQVAVGSQTLTILQDISLNIDQGESLAIVGVSGSGKTTLLGLLAGLDLPTSGRVNFEGVDLQMLDENQRAKIRARKVGFIFQSFQLLNNLTALENVMLPLELNNHAHARSEAQDLLEKVGLKDRMPHYPKQLSGGEQQRVAIARAFAMQPKILFADEPTGNLDQATADNIIHLIFELNKRYQTTIVCVTHDSTIANRCARKIHLIGGKVAS
jgi:putative ABC transport system ATP-binding protein